MHDGLFVGFGQTRRSSHRGCGKPDRMFVGVVANMTDNPLGLFLEILKIAGLFSEHFFRAKKQIRWKYPSDLLFPRHFYI